MSEAVNHMKPDDSLSNPAVPPSDLLTENHTPESGDRSHDEWQTVDFPDAISVDAIPAALESSPEAKLPEETLPEAKEQPTPQGLPEAEHLKQENTILRQQLSQLEEDLTQLQIELQLEVARFYCKEVEASEASAKAAQIQSLTEELTQAQEQIQKLSQEFERSQQTVEQKQALIETLTQQLENSQQRIAQLERECALSQQRYNEQVQLVSQAENTCADLRMRLHRQQQQTLQFKAALEKSVEMNATVQAAYSESAATELSPEMDTTDPSFLPKARPVQPWTNLTGKSIHRSLSVPRSQPALLPNLLSKLVKPAQEPAKQEPTEATSADVPQSPSEPSQVVESNTPVNSLPQPPQNALDELFPVPVEGLHEVPQEQVPSEPIFDLSPFIEAGEVAPDQIVNATKDTIDETVHQPVQEAAEPMPQESVSGTGDTLWADLARLIEPDLSQEEPITPEVVNESESHQQTQPVPQAAVPHDRSETAPEVERSSKAKPISLVSFPSQETQTPSSSTPEAPAPVRAANPFPSFTLRPLKEEALEDSVTAPIPERMTAQEEIPQAESDREPSPNWPSPILYPFRQPKKISSMAAVDLPTFPR